MKKSLLLTPFSHADAMEAIDQIEDAFAGRPGNYRRFPPHHPASETEVRKARKATVGTQRNFAELLGVSLDTVKAWEAGIRKPEAVASKLIRYLIKKPEFAAEFKMY